MLPTKIKSPVNRRLTHLDFLRLIAIFFVILNHSEAFFMPTNLQGEVKSSLLFFSNQIIKTAVPIFFMISGALLLPREESYSQLFRKRILRFLLVIVFFWSIQISVETIISGTLPTPSYVFSLLYTHGKPPNEVAVDWFLYAYLAILLLLPMLRTLSLNMKDRDYIYLFGLQITVAALLPTSMCAFTGDEISSRLNEYLPFTRVTQPDDVPFGTGFCAVFMLMGYFLEHRVHPTMLKRKGLGILILLSLVCLAAGAAMMSYCRSLRPDGYLPQSTIFLTCYIPLPCATLYLLARAFFLRVSIPLSVQRLLKIAAGGVLAVMLTENLFREAFTPVFDYFYPLYGGWLSSLPFAVLSFICALLFGIFLKKLPFLRRFL